MKSFNYVWSFCVSSRTGPFRLFGHFCMAQRFMFRSVVGYQVQLQFENSVS